MRFASAPIALRPVALTLCAAAAGCVAYDSTPSPVYGQPATQLIYTEPAPQTVVSVYVEPPLSQPPPILVGWAPPPMLVDVPPPMPFAGAVWIGGYWVWDGYWVWAAGRWAAPPWPYYTWIHPYYEHRHGRVVFITGFWAPPGVVFVPPPLHISITVVSAAPGVVPGPAPIGPQGVFVPAPPGSRPGLIVPAPLGTTPAVVISAPPLVNPGMRIQAEGRGDRAAVTIVAPPGATAGGRAFERAVPAQPHLAAALPPVVRALAPPPASRRPIPSFEPGRAPVPLPPPQPLRGLRPSEPPGRPFEPAMPAPGQVQPRERAAPREEVPALQRGPAPAQRRPDAPEFPPPRGPAVQGIPVPSGPAVAPREDARSGAGQMPRGREAKPDLRPTPERGQAERIPRGQRREEKGDGRDESRPRPRPKDRLDRDDTPGARD